MIPDCCGSRHSLGFVCTAEPGHKGDHVAEGPDDGEIYARWPQ